MSPTKVKELDNRKQGDRNACPICNPNPKRVTMDRLWQWSMKHTGEKPFRSQALDKRPEKA